MRTVILLGAMLIGDAILQSQGVMEYKMGEHFSQFFAVAFVVAMVMDVIDFLRENTK